MGGLSLQCVVANGTRLLGMSYTSRVDDNTSYDSSYVVLIQSNPNPASVDDISWSLVAAYPRLTSYPQDFSPLVCNVDPVTGVFSMMSYFNLTDPTVVIPDQYLLPRRKPGGFQYDPRNNRWSNFTLDPNYRWGDISATYALFQWPNTTTLYQANVGNSTTVNIGLLAPDKDDDSKQFVSITSWDLDPSVYGYPSRLFFGNNILYQFGTLVANNKTGALRNTLTRIPLSGDAATFMLPDDLPVYNATALDQCTPSFITANYYKDTLYVFCQGVDTDIEPGVGLVMKFRDGAVRDTALSNFSETDFDRISGASIQPIGGDHNQSRFAFVVNAPSGYSMEGMALDDADLGIVTSVGYYLNITEPYGFSITDPPNHTPAIIGGSVAGVLLLLAIAAYFLVRRRWPQWRRKLRAKIILMMSADDLNETPKFYKFEESSRQSFDSGRDKILVTDDMDLEGIVDVGTGYMQNVTFGQHPRPAFVTSLGDSDDSHGDVKEITEHPRNSRELLQVPPRTAAFVSLQSVPPAEYETSDRRISSLVRAIPPLPASTSSTTHSPTAPRLLYTQGVSDGTTSPWNIHMDQKKTDPDAEREAKHDSALFSEAAPPYSQHTQYAEYADHRLASLTAPSLPTPPTPTAPTWISGEVLIARRHRLGAPQAIVESDRRRRPGAPQAIVESDRRHVRHSIGGRYVASEIEHGNDHNNNDDNDETEASRQGHGTAVGSRHRSARSF